MRHRKEDNSISGFLTYDTNFFDCTFLSLIIVSPTKEGEAMQARYSHIC